MTGMPPTSELPQGRYRDALAVPEFRALAGSSLISILGDSVAYLAVTVLIYQRTGSALLSALTFAVAFLPYLFGGVLLSALVDRMAPRRLMMGCDALSGCVVAGIAVGSVPVPVIFGLLFVVGLIAPVRAGSAGALVAEVLPGKAFVPGRSILRIIAQSSQILGAGLGGLLIGPFGPRGALVADTLSFAMSACVIGVGVRRRDLARAAGPRQRLVADSLAGIGQIWALPQVRRLLLIGWLVPFIAVAPEALAAPAVSQAGSSASLVGLWLMAIPVGTVLGDLGGVWLLSERLRLRLVTPVALVIPLVLALFFLAPPMPVALTLLLLSGAASLYGLGPDQSLRDVTPVEIRGRMYALNTTGLMVGQGLGFVCAGALGSVFTAAHAIAATGAVGLLLLLIVLLLINPAKVAVQAA
jgi:MFS family permease